MPLRFEQEHSHPSEPIQAVRPPAAEMDQAGPVHLDHAYDRQPSEQRSERGTLLLKIVVGGIFAYVAVMAVGLVGMMFPRETHEIVRTVKQGVAVVRPDPPRQRVVVLSSAPASTDASVKPATAAPRKPRHRVVESPSFGKVEIVDSGHSHTATPKPPTPSVTVSVGDSKAASQPAN